MIVAIHTARAVLLGAILTCAASAPLQGAATFHHRGTAIVNGIEDLDWEGAEVATVMVAFPDGSREVTLLLMNDDQNLYAAAREMPYSAGINVLNVESWSGASADPCFEQNVVDTASLTWELVDFGVKVLFEEVLYFDLFGSFFCAGRDGDVDDGGVSNGAGTAGHPAFEDGFMEVSHPLDTTDDAHDLSAAPGEIIHVILQTARCIGEACGVGNVQRRVFLEPAGLVFYSDFEVGDKSEWSFFTPPS